jgi:hypothetical protein
VASIREAIVQFRDGYFDLILLGHSIPVESRERITFLIRASDSRIPVVCITDDPCGHDSFADATIHDDGDDLPQVIEKLASLSKEGCISEAREADGEDRPYLMGDVRALQMLWPRKPSTAGGGIR